MRHFFSSILISALIFSIGCTTTVRDKAPEAYHEQGVDLAGSGKYQQAIVNFNQAIRLDPNNAKYYYNRGIAHGNLDQNQQALEDFDTAIRLNPNYAEAYSNRGFVYMVKLGNKKKACYDWKLACELGDCKNIRMAKEKGDCR